MVVEFISDIDSTALGLALYNLMFRNLDRSRDEVSKLENESQKIRFLKRIDAEAPSVNDVRLFGLKKYNLNFYAYSYWDGDLILLFEVFDGRKKIRSIINFDATHDKQWEDFDSKKK